jgi:DNA-binding protein HU-beta
MNKGEFTKAVAAEAGVKESEAAKILAASDKVVIAALKKGDKVTVGLGAFEAKKREARDGINPATKAKIKIPASVAPSFKAGKGLKDALN